MQYNTPTKCRLTKLIDGDTLECQILGTDDIYRIRLNSIDAPELNQPAGWESKHELYKILEEMNFEFFVVSKGVGFNNRIIADIYESKNDANVDLKKKSINYEMCNRGQAWYYELNKNTCNIIEQGEFNAKLEDRGLWNRKSSTPIHPFEWRRDKKKMTSLQQRSEEKRKSQYMKKNSLTLQDLENSYPSKTSKPLKEEKEINQIIDNEDLPNILKDGNMLIIDTSKSTIARSNRKNENNNLDINNDENKDFFNKLRNANKKMYGILSKSEENKKAKKEHSLKKMEEALSTSNAKDKMKNFHETRTKSVEVTSKIVDDIITKKQKIEENKRKDEANKNLKEQEDLNDINIQNMKDSFGNEDIDNIFNADDFDFDFDEDNLDNVLGNDFISDQHYNSREMDYDNNNKGYRNQHSGNIDIEDIDLSMPPMDFENEPSIDYDMPPMDEPSMGFIDYPPPMNENDYPPMDFGDEPPMDFDIPSMENSDIPDMGENHSFNDNHLSDGEQQNRRNRFKIK